MDGILQHSGGQCLVRVHVSENRVAVFSDDSALFSEPRSRTRIRFTRSDATQCAKLTFSGRPDDVITLYNPDHIESLRLVFIDNPEIGGNNDASFRLMFAGIVIAALAVIIFLASYLNIVAGTLTHITPKTWESRLANLALERMRESGTCGNPASQRALAHVVNPLVKAARITGYPPVRIIPVTTHGDEAKLFALPGAVAVVNDKFLQDINGADRLAATVANTLVMMRDRRPLKRFIKGAGSVTFAVALLPFLHGTEPAASAASRLLRSEQSGEDDTIADIEAATLMLDAGIRANGVFLLLKDASDASYLPTPALNKRMDRLKHFLQQGEYGARQQALGATPPMTAENMRLAAQICD